MIYRRGLVLSLILGAAATGRIAQLSTRIVPVARAAAFWPTRTMPTATRRQKQIQRQGLSSLSPAPVTSCFVSKESDSSCDNDKSKSKSPQAVIPTRTVSSSLVVTPPTTCAATSTLHDSRTLLQSWANHSHADYHNFSETEAKEIRSALLGWYTNHRRKLPWRGDPPPFDGSTSGINSNSSGNKKRGRSNGTGAAVKKNKPNNSGEQKSITSFFSTRSKSKEKVGNDKTIDNGSNSRAIKSEPEPNEAAESMPSKALLDQAIPVTGYGVWVSEIMLQQTRVEAVIPFWIKWMKSFPTVFELAAATEDEVNAHWAGLGFYRRARYLHQGAKYVVEELDGELPTTPQGLSKIAGIGPYTASAIASIAFGVCVPVVDGNVCRVLSRLKGIANHIKHPILKDKLGWKLAAQIVEAGDGSSPGLVNQALMELGATYCAPAGSGIDERDPLRDYYLSTQLGRAYLAVLQEAGSNGCDDIFSPATQPEFTKAGSKEESCELCDPDGVHIVLEKFRESIASNSTTMEEAARIGHSAFPTDPPKTEKREEDLAMAVIRNRSETGDSDDSVRYLMVRRPKEGLLAGQWEFPNVCVQIRKKKNQKKTDPSTSKIPRKADRGRALTKFLLQELFLDDANDEISSVVSNLSRRVEKEPLEHIFSHVKHYMWVEVGDLTGVNLGEDDLEWASPSGKEVRWMNKHDMKKVGITSGVKKVLQSVEKSSIITTKSKSKKQRKS